ncbi:superoxide dismutase [Cu-Zn] SodC2, partial [Pseudomonas syringae pv. actinidiae]|nr:superoxide dismutase [Cu-Zn] SodC2 [Pseudomonas syringae pv. actinidiae]
MLTHAAQSNVHFDQQIRDALKPMKSHLWLGL